MSGSGDTRSHLTTLAQQDLRQPIQRVVIKPEASDYSRGKHEMDVILALIYALPVESELLLFIYVI